MILKSIYLKNFRLHKSSVLEFSDELNYIVGGNGQGKTTILESIYYLCTTKSLNGSSDYESVNFNEEFFEIKGKFFDLTENNVVINFLNESKRKNIFIDEKQIYKSSEVIGKFPVVTLTQSDHAVTFGSPGDRRKFIDSVISQTSETYLKILIEYNKTLKQRSSLLSQIKERYSPMIVDQLDAWSEALLKNGSEIVKHRLKFINEFNIYVSEAYKNVMEESEIPFIDYDFYGSKNVDEIKDRFNEELTINRNDELRRGTNLVGPHRDEFQFILNNKELRKYGSQGQHKTFQIALRFAQFFYMKDKIQKSPIFLMDDVFGELDSYRAKKISHYLKEIGQAFITMTDFTNYKFLARNEKDKLIEVSEGKAVYA
jgi:DNA replication and repair protein RecF